MNRFDAERLLGQINTLLTNEGKTQEVQALVTRLEQAGYPVVATVKHHTIVRYRPEIVATVVKYL